MGVQPNNGIRGLYRYDFDVIEILQKEIDQMQVVNNELTAEIHRLQQDERLALTDVEQLTRDREAAEDMLWTSQQELRVEQSYLKGFVSATVVSIPAAVAFIVGSLTFEQSVLVSLLTVFGLVFGVAAVGGLAVSLTRAFGTIPEAKGRVQRNQRAFDRAVLKEMSL